MYGSFKTYGQSETQTSTFKVSPELFIIPSLNEKIPPKELLSKFTPSAFNVTLVPAASVTNKSKHFGTDATKIIVSSSL